MKYVNTVQQQYPDQGMHASAESFGMSVVAESTENDSAGFI
jgi:hypothetical protein